MGLAERLKEIENSYFCYPPKEWPIYPFLNENNSGYLPMFNLDGKSLLTVGSSFDHAINASLTGCRDITIVDICPLTKEFKDLKLASFLELEREEYVRFIHTLIVDYETNPEFLSAQIFAKVRDRLQNISLDSYQLWDYYVHNYNLAEKLLIFMENDGVPRSRLFEISPYLINDESYQQARDAIEETNINIIIGDIRKVNFARKYDVMWFSNVLDYIGETDVQALFQKAEEALNPNGQMLFKYYFYHRLVKNPDSVIQIKGYNLDLKEIPSVRLLTGEEEHKDKIALYQKKIG